MDDFLLATPPRHHLNNTKKPDFVPFQTTLDSVLPDNYYCIHFFSGERCLFSHKLVNSFFHWTLPANCILYSLFPLLSLLFWNTAPDYWKKSASVMNATETQSTLKPRWSEAWCEGNIVRNSTPLLSFRLSLSAHDTTELLKEEIVFLSYYTFPNNKQKILIPFQPSCFAKL